MQFYRKLTNCHREYLIYMLKTLFLRLVRAALECDHNNIHRGWIFLSTEVQLQQYADTQSVFLLFFNLWDINGTTCLTIFRIVGSMCKNLYILPIFFIQYITVFTQVCKLILLTFEGTQSNREKCVIEGGNSRGRATTDRWTSCQYRQSPF